MKQLIINADDFGCDVFRNKGILEALKQGAIKSVSILPNGPALDDAIRGTGSLKDRKVSTGIHINLSEGRPLTEGLKIIAGKDGRFLSKKGALALFSGQADKELKNEIEKEMDAQIKCLLEYGINISHMDSHHHVHILPAVLDIAIKKAREYSIGWMRIPCEYKNTLETLKTDDVISGEVQFFSKYAALARPFVTGARIDVTDYFTGLYMKGRLSSDVLKELASKLSDGVTEMMVHPGIEAVYDPLNPFTGFSTKQRETELNALLDPDFFHALKNNSVETKSFIEVER